MNKAENQKGPDSRRGMALAVIAVHVVSIAAIVVLFRTLPQDNRFMALKDTIAGLEKCVASEEIITNSMVELSNLARKSGYELALNDIIRDHRNAISGIKSRLPELKKAGNKSEGRIIVYVIIILVVQGSLLLLTLFRVSPNPSFNPDTASPERPGRKSGGKKTAPGKI